MKKHLNEENRMTIDKEKIKDVRGAFCYQLLASKSSRLFLRVKHTTESPWKVFLLRARMRTHLADPRQQLYNDRLRITYEKAVDVYKLSALFPRELTAAEKEYWYPAPNETNTINYREEESKQIGCSQITEYCKTEEEKSVLMELL